MGKWSRIEVLHDTPASFSRSHRSKALGERDCAAGLSQGQGSGASEQRFDRSAKLRQNSICPAIDRSAISAVSRASRTSSSDNFTG